MEEETKTPKNNPFLMNDAEFEAFSKRHFKSGEEFGDRDRAKVEFFVRVLLLQALSAWHPDVEGLLRVAEKTLTNNVSGENGKAPFRVTAREGCFLLMAKSYLRSFARKHGSEWRSRESRSASTYEVRRADQFRAPLARRLLSVAGGGGGEAEEYDRWSREEGTAGMLLRLLRYVLVASRFTCAVLQSPRFRKSPGRDLETAALLRVAERTVRRRLEKVRLAPEMTGDKLEDLVGSSRAKGFPSEEQLVDVLAAKLGVP